MGIVALDAGHHARVMAFLRREPARTVFLVGDIENFGYKTEFQDVWGEIEGEGIRAVLLRYFGHFVIYAERAFDVEGFARLAGVSRALDQLSGPPEACEPLARRLGISKSRPMRLLALEPGSFREDLRPGVRLKRAALSDLDALLAFQATIREFGRGPAAGDAVRKNLESGTARTYFVEDGGEIVATASSAAESSTAAMVTGVATRPDRRNRGFATACLSALCADLTREGKTVCLFYDNPAAGRIYLKAGFRDVGPWITCSR
jgi:predicted GNAT family acetyltransferase